MKSLFLFTAKNITMLFLYVRTFFFILAGRDREGKAILAL